MPAAPETPPPPLEEVREALKKARWLDVMAFMKRIATRVWGMKNDAHLDELIQAAVFEVLDSAEKGEGRLWNPRSVSLQSYVVGVMRSIRSHKARDGEREVLYDRTLTQHPNPAHNPEHDLRRGAKLARGLERRDRALAGMDDVARALYEEIERGTFRLKGFAKEHGLSVPEARAARERMKYALQKAIDADGVAPDSSGSRLAAPPARSVETTNEDEGSREP